MHSEVFVRFTDEIRIEHLTSGLPAASDPRAVLAETYLHEDPEVLLSSVYARSEAHFGYIIFKDDRRSIRLLVEGRTNKGDIQDLVRRSERLADGFINSGRSHGYRLDCALISLYAGFHPITTGRYRTFGQQLLNRFADTIFGDVVVGLFTWVLTGVLTGQWVAGAVVGTASIFCFFAWLAIEIRRGRHEFEYEQF
ncbi:MAG TPA: hypothetical protein VFJ82_07605 [Longimicrobium sp.]|nr:hypothetical protein [Longimicrobium sp.]